MNIVQQIGGSVGAAVMSVILTDQLLNKPAVQAGKAAEADPSAGGELHAGTGWARCPAQMAEAFAFTFWVALVLILVTFIPAFLLPRKALAPAEEQPMAPVAIH